MEEEFLKNLNGRGAEISIAKTDQEVVLHINYDL